MEYAGGGSDSSATSSSLLFSRDAPELPNHPAAGSPPLAGVVPRAEGGSATGADGAARGRGHGQQDRALHTAGHGCGAHDAPQPPSWASHPSCPASIGLHTVGGSNIAGQKPYKFIGFLVMMLKNHMKTYGF